MSAVIVIDESGNIGHGERYFVMASIIANNPRILKNIYSSLPISGAEAKFHSSYEKDIIKVLKEIAKSDLSIVFVAIDKYSPKYSNLRGNDLYHAALYDLLSQSAGVLMRNDVSIYLDSVSSIKAYEFSKMAEDVFGTHKRNVRRSIKADSAQNKCIQLVDFVAGAIRRAYEYDDRRFYDIIEKKVSVARGF